jgi:hypothetical protein
MKPSGPAFGWPKDKLRGMRSGIHVWTALLSLEQDETRWFAAALPVRY